MRQILITGGAGFIGSHLAPILAANGYLVKVIDNLSPQIHGENASIPNWLAEHNCEFINASILDDIALNKALANVDCVIHLAAETGTGQSMYQMSRYTEVNVLGTAKILDAITNNTTLRVKKIVLASSRSVYGEGAYRCEKCSPTERQYPKARSAEQLRMHKWEPICQRCSEPLDALATLETDPIQPASIYAATKYSQEDLVAICAQSLGIEYTILRLQNVYGEGQSLNNPYTGILSIFSTLIRRGLALPIYEDGNESRDFIHVSDVANAFVKAIQTTANLNIIVNVGTGKKTSVSEVATQLCRAFKKGPNLILTREYRLGDIRHNYADTELLRKSLGLLPEKTLEAGLADFASWVLTQPLPEDTLDKAVNELKSKKLMG